MDKKMDELEAFMAISVPLTGYSKVALQATGMGAGYLEAIRAVIGHSMTTGYFSVVAALLESTGGKEPAVNKEIRVQLLASLQYGPLTRNIIQMWYWGAWLPLPDQWVAQYGKGIKNNAQHFISAAAYQEGLIWKAMGSHAQGAKQPGFGSWGVKPL